MTDDTRHDSTDSEPSSDRADGLLVVEPRSAAVGRLVDGRVDTVATLEEQITGSARAGEGDPDRFERERDRQVRAFFDAVATAAAETFLGDDAAPRVAVGGPTTTVDAFLDGDHLDDRLTDRLVGTYTVEHAAEPGLRELVDAAGADLLDAETRRRRAAIEAFFTRLRDGDRVVYGDADLDRALQRGTVETALVSAAVDRDRRDEIAAAVADQGGEAVVLPTDTDRGARFAETFRVGALLRESSA